MYQIIRQKRKTVSIRIDDNMNIIIKVPQYLKASEVNQFIQEHHLWIKKRVEQTLQHRAENDWRLTDHILYLGEYKVICKVADPCNKGEIVLGTNQLIIKAKDLEDQAEAAKLIEQFFKQQAQIILTKLTDYYVGLIGVSYNKITIRKQRTRWGSCSAKGNISYNVKLLCAPEKMIAYIVLHEVMHLKHFNHGQAFWQEIREIMPDYKERMNYFKQFGQDFML